MNNAELRSALTRRHACSEAMDWLGDRDIAAMWRECPRADWLLWYLERCDGWSRAALNACVLDIAADAMESARPVAGKKSYWAAVEAAHRQVREAIESGDRGKMTAASDAASDAARAASAASDAARAAARAASAASAAAWAAASAASAASAAARARCADIVRRHFPVAPVLRGTKDGGEPKDGAS